MHLTCMHIVDGVALVLITFLVATSNVLTTTEINDPFVQKSILRTNTDMSANIPSQQNH
jgi:hypothetical protein